MAKNEKNTPKDEAAKIDVTAMINDLVEKANKALDEYMKRSSTN